MPEVFYRISQAATRLGKSKYKMRRLAEEGLVRHKVSETGQLLFPESELTRIEEEGVPAVPALMDPEEDERELDDESDEPHSGSAKDALLAPPSSRVISSAEKVLASKHKLERMRIVEDMETIREARHQRREQKAQRTAAEEAQRTRIAEAERASEARAEEQRHRREWLDSWIERAIFRLPYGCPKEYQLDVRQQVEAALEDLDHSEGYSVVSPLIDAVSAKVLVPYQRQQDTEKAIQEGLRNLSSLAQSFGTPTKWQVKAEQEARAALRSLPQGTSFPEKKAAATAAVHKVNAEFEHVRSCERLVEQISLWCGTDDERRRAKLAVEKALKALVFQPRFGSHTTWADVLL